jgi:hypothetical protein
MYQTGDCHICCWKSACDNEELLNFYSIAQLSPFVRSVQMIIISVGGIVGVWCVYGVYVQQLLGEICLLIHR